MVNLLSSLEKIGNMALSVREAMTRLIASDAFAEVVKFFQSIPTDIQETELFRRISFFHNAEITYTDVKWLQDILGDMTYDKAVEVIKKKTNPTPLDEYVLTIIDSLQLSHREKTIVLLAHFEELVYQTMAYERKATDRIKTVATNSTCDTHKMDMVSYRKVLIAGIVFIVFSNTDNYTNTIDKRIPFRNNILHRGMLEYSSVDAKCVYELLVYFIAELAKMETEK